jgi:hypothetical protein
MKAVLSWVDRPSHRWEENIKTGIVSEVVYWIDLAHDKVYWHGIVTIVINSEFLYSRSFLDQLHELLLLKEGHTLWT